MILSLAVVRRLVSGGQTGADRAALDAAIELGIEYGGWCPRGGLADDRPQAPGLLGDYPALRETPTQDSEVRTRWNVRDSDATLVLSMSLPPDSPGTRLTIRVAEELGRPYAVLRADDPEPVRDWIGSLERNPSGVVLNVAGPRESQSPGLYAAALRTLIWVLAPG